MDVDDQLRIRLRRKLIVDEDAVGASKAKDKLGLGVAAGDPHRRPPRDFRTLRWVRDRSTAVQHAPRLHLLLRVE